MFENLILRFIAAKAVRVFFILFCLGWLTLFTMLTYSTIPKKNGDVILMPRDFRHVPELLDPPIELTNTEHYQINKMIRQLKSASLPKELSDHIFDTIDPAWPFPLRKGVPMNPNHKVTTPLGDRLAMSAYQFVLYDPQEFDIEKLLQPMSKNRIDGLSEMKAGTQLKLKLHLEDYGQVMFKPKRYEIHYETSPNHFYFSDFERHFSEIASFHLDRMLGWFRVPPVAGRLLNVSHDVRRLAPEKLQRTIFISPANNWCFYGRCKYYCDTAHAFCGNPYMVEGSLATFLPPQDINKMFKKFSPWRRSYSKFSLAGWRNNKTYCKFVRTLQDFKSIRRILDITDTHIFDFLIGNLDRHHYHFFDGFPDNDTFFVHFDHGRGFGRINYDEMSILGPLYHCCNIRYPTLYKLITFFNGTHSLGNVLKLSLQRDPVVSPVLVDGHFKALDRRVGKVLLTVARCLDEYPLNQVVINDGF